MLRRQKKSFEIDKRDKQIYVRLDVALTIIVIYVILAIVGLAIGK